MSYYIYGLRLRGDAECRYIGMTRYTPEGRLANLTGTAREREKANCPRLAPDGFYRWLLDNTGSIDAFKIAKVETAIEARAMEKALIALVLQLGQRLLNVQHVPDEQRIGYIRTGWSQEVAMRRAAQKAA